MFNYILNSIKTGQCFCSSSPHTMNRISNSAIFFFATKFKILQPSMLWSEWIESYCNAGVLDMGEVKVVFLLTLAVLYREMLQCSLIQKTKVPESEQIVKNKIFPKDNAGHFPPSLAGYDLWCVKSPGLFESVWVSTVLLQHLTSLFQPVAKRWPLSQNWHSFITAISFLRNDRKMLSQSWPEIKKRYWLLGFLL